MKKVTNKVALVTGSSRGIGKSIALRLAKEGHFVIVHYANNQSDAEMVLKVIQENGGEGAIIGADLSTLNGIQQLFTSFDKICFDQNKDNQLDILVNNAGIGHIASLEETTEAAFDNLISINVKAPLFLTQHALPRLKNGAAIINISSYVTRVTSPNVFAYSMSKGAIDTFTLLLAKQLGKQNITVNAVQPGVINTDMNARTLGNEEGRKSVSNQSVFNRIGEPEDVADIVAFLASKDSRWITGQFFDASGGAHI